jgi:hypothetical protein
MIGSYVIHRFTVDFKQNTKAFCYLFRMIKTLDDLREKWAQFFASNNQFLSVDSPSSFGSLAEEF